jgi:hypothetical protein
MMRTSKSLVKMILAGHHPVYIMARYGLDSRELAQIVAAVAGVKVAACELPVSGQRVGKWHPIFRAMGHIGLPVSR